MMVSVLQFKTPLNTRFGAITQSQVMGMVPNPDSIQGFEAAVAPLLEKVSVRMMYGRKDHLLFTPESGLPLVFKTSTQPIDTIGAWIKLGADENDPLVPPSLIKIPNRQFLISYTGDTQTDAGAFKQALGGAISRTIDQLNGLGFALNSRSTPVPWTVESVTQHLTRHTSEAVSGTAIKVLAKRFVAGFEQLCQNWRPARSVLLQLKEQLCPETP